MMLFNFFVISSLFSFLILISVFLYYLFLREKKFSYFLSRFKQGEILRAEELEGLLPFIKDSFSSEKRWFSYRILETIGDTKYKERAIFDLENSENYIKSAAINYLKNVKKKEVFEIILKFLKSEDVLLKLHSINTLKFISMENYDFFKRNFEERPILFIEVALELFPHLDKEKRKELFFIIKKHFCQKEDVMEKILPYIEILSEEDTYEEILYQLDIFPPSFQEGFINLFLKRREIQKYFQYFDFKFKTVPGNLRYIYVSFFSQYYCDKDFRQALEFFLCLNEKEKEIFLKDYFPEPDQFIQFIISLKGGIPASCLNIIVEKLTLLKHPKTLETMENLLDISKNKDSLLFKFFNLIKEWKEDEIKGLILWILTKMENPLYRDRVNNFIKEKKFDF
ncbi:MAG: hypothetical protein WHV67_04160 [Thermoanaerobaculia bacterium]